jgi:hypothetical protein
LVRPLSILNLRYYMEGGWARDFKVNPPFGAFFICAWAAKTRPGWAVYLKLGVYCFHIIAEFPTKLMV